jgi:Protein of unknown function (DUF2752)
VNTWQRPVELNDSHGGLLRAGAIAMVGVAAVWKVSPVHPPLACPLRSTTGIPCPFCGMTRAVVAAVHGDVIGSLRFNPGGIFVLALAIYVIAKAKLPRNTFPLWSIWVVFGLLWVWNITFNPTF